VTPTLLALTGFIAWTLCLLVVMELQRVGLVAAKRIAANEFRPDNANLSPFMQRLARAHANCLENLPVLGGLMLVAVVSGKSSITDSLALVMLAARVVQSLVHLSSLSVLAVNVRFLAFVVQLVIALYWAGRLLAA
jgi:uncharacterized MAPEG superfamily protein